MNRLNLINRITKLNGIYNLNPFECDDEFLKIKDNKNLSFEKFFNLKLKDFFKLILKQFKGSLIAYKLFLKNKFSKNNIDLSSDIFLISYDDCKNISSEDKYFGSLKNKYQLKGRKKISQINIDVYGVKPSNLSIIKIISHIEAIKILFLSQIIFLMIFLKLFKSYFSRKSSKETIINYELLSKSLINRLIYWDFLFKKFFKKAKKNTSIIFLLEGSSWEWLLMYHIPKNKSIAGYIHGFAREDQFGLYNLINLFSHHKNLKILVSESWSLDLIKDKTNNNKIYKVENTRYPTDISIKRKPTLKIDFLIIGGINLKLTTRMIELFSTALEKTNRINKYKVMIRLHPNNKNNFIPKKPQVIDEVNISLRSAINQAKVIIASGDTAGVIDSLIYKKKCFLFLPENSCDLCPVPKKFRYVLRNFEDFLKIVEDNKNSNYDNIKINLPFFYTNKDFYFWAKFIDSQ